MSILGWLVVGFIAGGLAGIATKSEQQGCLATIVVGILGALIGGALYRAATDEANVMDEFDLKSVFVAFIGAAALLLVLQAFGVRGRRR